MILTFKIEYKTSWGEELKLVFGRNIIDMHYHPNGIWTAVISNNDYQQAKAQSITEYHYECWKDGKFARREWKNHIAPNGKNDLVQNDNWIDIPKELTNHDNKYAGTAIPVFSIRTEDSFGIGDFHDLKKMVDWASATGQHIIQLLPINDTTMTGTWHDSYPYSANSIYALHPQFIYLPDAGVRKDKQYKKLQAELEALENVDFERVNKEKDRLLRKAFANTKKEVCASAEFLDFVNVNVEWLNAYCAYRILLAKTGTANISEWGKYSKYEEALVNSLLIDNKEEADYQTFVQFHLHRQLLDAKSYALTKGVVFKGDLPIGVSRNSVDAWQHPELFNMDSQAGAPPDAFAANGQVWGFPTYNWEKMAEDNFAWWKARLKNMEQYFDLFRIDHILGFFRIWEVPAMEKSGLLGHFSPALPYSSEELKEKGFDINSGKYTSDGIDTLFIEDPRKKNYWHPRISAQNTSVYQKLTSKQKKEFDNLYNDFFFHRHNEFWRNSAFQKLPELLSSTKMLACGEDLGMIPDCVPGVMKDLNILSLEIQRMPKQNGQEFSNTWKYPYMSVCATSTHDMSPLRAWWKEDRTVTQHFWNNVLGKNGDAPIECTTEIIQSIIMMHLQSASMLAILPIQDYLALNPELCFSNPEKERINIPSISSFYWRFRMKTTIETIIKNSITPHLHSLIKKCGRK